MRDFRGEAQGAIRRSDIGNRIFFCSLLALAFLIFLCFWLLASDDQAWGAWAGIGGAGVWAVGFDRWGAWRDAASARTSRILDEWLASIAPGSERRGQE